MAYRIELYYGFKTSYDYAHDKDCIQHVFEAVDPAEPDEDNIIPDRLADELDTYVGSNAFTWDNICIDIPESIVRRIQTDAVQAYLKRGGN